MKHCLTVKRDLRMIGLASKIVYMQKNHWCGCSARQQKLSFMGPRRHYSHDPRGICPLLIFLCGGGWQKVDRNAWLPNLVSFAQQGYAVASVDYSVAPDTAFPEQIVEIKTAIRFLRAHASDFQIDPGQVVIMGESAGGYLAGLAALTGDQPAYQNTLYPGVSDAVQAAVLWYAPTGLQLMDNSKLHVKVDDFPDLCGLAGKQSPPFLLLHGLADHTVPWSQSERLYDALQNQGVASELILLENACHGDGLFIQDPVKERMLQFINRALQGRAPAAAREE